MEAVILIGIQASGKSTFFKEHFADTHVRINLDMLKTRPREEKLVDACIAMRQKFVVDNTNPTAWDRLRYIPKAKEKGFRIIGYYFDSKLEDALTRNSGRGWDKNIPRYAIIGTFERLQKPSLKEGFDVIYHVKINNIESKRPMGSIEIQQNYLLSELLKLTMYFNSHLEFYRYYRMKSTFLDDKLFVRGREDFHLHLDNMMIYVDPEFSTSQDYMVAKIMANDRLEVYLKTEIDALSIKANNPNWGQVGYLGSNSLQWTESKTALVELIYALHASGSINNGQTEIRELSAFFEQAFNIRITDIYRTFLELKLRTIQTKYIDYLRAVLLRKMQEEG